jgi:hypothetical protein
MKKHRAPWGARLWAAFLSLTFAVLLFPTIVNEHGIALSALYIALGVGFIWSLYFAIGRLLEHAVAEELRRRGIEAAGWTGRVDAAPKVR